MVGIIVLGGGGNEKLSYSIDKLFFKGVKNILYIPLAWKTDNFDGCLKWFTTLTGKIGKFKIDMMTNPKLKLKLDKYDAIYIGGGNTYKLLKRLRIGKLESKLMAFYKKGGKIFGGSAGAIVFGNSIDIASCCKDADRNIVGIKNKNGMNLVKNRDIQCHYTGNQSKTHINYVKKTKREVLAIPEESGILVHGNSYKVIGKKQVVLFTKTGTKKYKPGQKINL